MKWTNTNTLTYAISTLPKTTEWGKDHRFDDKTSIFCKCGTNALYTLWIVGHVLKMWFFERGNPAAQVSISIVPLDPEDGKVARCLLAAGVVGEAGEVT